MKTKVGNEGIKENISYGIRVITGQSHHKQIYFQHCCRIIKHSVTHILPNRRRESAVKAQTCSKVPAFKASNLCDETERDHTRNA